MENLNNVDEQETPLENGNSSKIIEKLLPEMENTNVKYGESLLSTSALAYVPDLEDVESVELREARLAIRKQRVSYKFCVEKALREMRECIEHSRSTLKSIGKNSEGSDISVVSTSNPPPKRKLSLADLIPSSSKTMKK